MVNQRFYLDQNSSRVIFDLQGTLRTSKNATLWILDTKSWGEYGPKYKNPIFQFNALDQSPRQV
jgi:hypothetical protein